MNLRQLDVFLAVVEEGSFSGAARVAMLTQSTISQHMAALEEELGVQLLERSRNGVVLTEAGRILRKHARSLVGELRATETAMRRHRGIEQTSLRLGVSTIPGAYMVPTVLAKLGEKFPQLNVVVLQGDSRTTVEWLAAREIEAGVVGKRFEERGFTFAEVGEDRISLVVGRQHPWARRGTLTARDLYDGVFVAREPGSGTGATVTEALRDAGIDTARLRTRAEIGGMEAIKAAVLAGVGASFLSHVAVASDVERGDLVIVPVKGLTIARPFYLVRRSGRDLAPAAEAFWKLMIEVYGRSGAPSTAKGSARKGAGRVAGRRTPRTTGR
ncbi:MAG TPA: selenium metabolism-associated LysR family transcriptional regulator [Candidatus Eisenbacteria bacterium]